MHTENLLSDRPSYEHNEVWDEQRVARHDALAEAIGRLMITTAVEHIASGQLVGYTTIAVDSSSQERAEQDNTIVLPGHQGHRLGLWAKLANLDELARRYPRLTQVRTWNAEENAFMLNINVQMGFKPVGGEAVMRKTLIDQDQLREM